MNLLGWVDDIEEAIAEDRFEWIYKQDQCIGFFTWLVKYKGNEKYVYVGNLFIYPQCRNRNNCLIIRKMMKTKFPNAKGYWHNNKKDKFVYR